MKINIGAGVDIKPGYINVDNYPLEGIDKIMDLNKCPWDFEDNSVDEVLAYQILEHLDDIPEKLREIHRITKHGAITEIGVPYFASAGAWSDLTHKHPFGYFSLDYMAANKVHKHSVGGFHTHEYGKEKFNILDRRFVFGKLHRLDGVKWFAHKFPMFYELYLAFIFPPRHIEFTIETVKTETHSITNNHSPKEQTNRRVAQTSRLGANGRVKPVPEDAIITPKATNKSLGGKDGN